MPQHTRRTADAGRSAFRPASSVVVEGNFETDTLTSAQRRTLDALIPALARDFHIAGSMVGGHRDFANTRCPGRHLYAEIPRLRALIADGR